MRALAVILALLVATPAGAASLRRFAMVIGSNDGGPERPRLRFAVSDAAAFAGVIQELGGVASTDTLQLAEPDRRALDAGLAEVGRRLAAARAPDTRLELVLYYSGHSDETGLLLGGEVYSYAELRRALAALPADVRIAVLDSCSSGALTRGKGGVRRAPFAIDEASRVRGHAFLTSSSDDESAQESDRVGGSFFTHFLVSGLRGAADVSDDGRVTLTEAYQFAYHETLARTERTRAGPQHAAYDIQLAGTGDLVLTDLRETSAGLALDTAVNGRVYVRDASDRLVVELRKLPGRDVEIGLAPGAYRVTVDENGKVGEAHVQVTAGSRTPLSAARFTPLTREAVATRGGAGPALERREMHATVVPHASDARLEARFALHFPLGRLGRLDGLEIGLIGSRIDGDVHGVQLDLGGSIVGGTVRGAQMGVAGFTVGGDLRGVQAAVGGGQVTGDVQGAQLAVGAVQAGGDVNGAQGAVGAAWSGGRLDGLQTAVGFTSAKGDSRGLQAAVGATIVSGDFVGMQTAVGGTVTTGTMKGLQASVGGAWAERIDGVQTSVGFAAAREVHGLQTALVDVAGEVHGLQLGLINVGGEVDGAQVGLINVARDADATIGLLNFIERGRIDLEVAATELHPLHAELHTGSQGVYGILLGATDPRKETIDGWMYGLGVGGRVRLGILDLDVAGTAANLQRRGDPDPANVLATARATLGLRVLPGVSVFAGPSVNQLIQWNGEDRDPGVALQSVDHQGEVTVRTWPGVSGGIRLTPHGF